MNRKILLIGIGILLIGLIIVGWLFLFNNPEGTISETIRDVLPFGQGSDDLNSQSADNDSPEQIAPIQNEPGKKLPALFRISEIPVSGAVGIIKNNSEFVRYTDRATGHIYDVNPTTLEKIKIANNTLPKIYQALFKKDGSGVVYVSLQNDSDSITYTSIDLIPPKGTTTNALYTETPTILRGDMVSLTVSDSGKLAFYSKDDASIETSAFNGSSIQPIYNSLFRDWLISWSGNTITLLTKPSAYVPGNAYALNPTTGILKKLKGPLNGLTLIRNSAENKLLYSYNDRSLTRTFYEDAETKYVGELSSTFADKCVWGKKLSNVLYCGIPSNGVEANEPDLWYQGRSHYSDYILKTDVNSGISETIINPKKDFNVDIDVVNPFLTPDEDYLIFTNKNDLSLWALKLVE